MSEQQLWAVRLQSGEYLKGGASGPWVTATKDLAGAFANTVPGRTVVPVTLIETAELDALRAAEVIAAINESGTHRVVPVCPDDGNILADDGVCGFCGNAALKGGEG